MTAGEQGTFIKKAIMSKGFGFELIESTISASPTIFVKVRTANI
jgi:hypothetical protein